MHWPFLRTLLSLPDATRGSSRMDVKAEAFSILITVARKMNMNLPVLSPVQVASPLSLGVLTSESCLFDLTCIIV